jgi:hypothetical protein
VIIMPANDDPGLYALKVGDRVQVFDINGPRRGQPEGGWDGTVAKVGRTLIHVNYSAKYRHRPQVFRMDTGRSNDSYSHQFIQTVEEAARRQYVGKLRTRLRAGGIDLSMRHTFTTQTLEALVAALDATTNGDASNEETTR